MGTQPSTGLGPPFCKELKKGCGINMLFSAILLAGLQEFTVIITQMLLYRDHMVPSHDSSLKVLPLMNGIRLGLVWLSLTGMCRSERPRCDP